MGHWDCVREDPGRQQPCWGSLFCTNLTQPTGALDSATGVEVLKLLMEQCRKGENTVIIVTHNSLIADIADIVVRVKNGKIKSVVDNPSPKNIEEVEW